MKEKEKQLFFDFVKKNDIIPLYGCIYGSDLYGTRTKKSDTDIKGIFLPSIKDCFLNNISRSYTYHSGDDNQRNTEDDIDIQVWSLHYWLDLVKKGDTNAIDILYSVSNPDCKLFYSSYMDVFFNNPFKLFNLKQTKGYKGYAITQAKKYGIRGSRLGVIKELHNEFKHMDEKEWSQPLSQYIEQIERYFGNEKYCYREINKSGPQERDSLVICGKIYLEDIMMGDFCRRIKDSYEKYGERSRQALENKGLDFKALSHAYRAIIQTKQLLIDGDIVYPFRGKELETLMNIKQGLLNWKKIEDLIYHGLDEIEKLQETSTIESCYDHKFITDNILSIYDRIGDEY